MQRSNMKWLFKEFLKITISAPSVWKFLWQVKNKFLTLRHIYLQRTKRKKFKISWKLTSNGTDWSQGQGSAEAPSHLLWVGAISLQLAGSESSVWAVRKGLKPGGSMAIALVSGCKMLLCGGLLSWLQPWAGLVVLHQGLSSSTQGWEVKLGSLIN